MIVSFKDNNELKESMALSMVGDNGERLWSIVPRGSNKTDSEHREKYDLLSFGKPWNILVGGLIR
jgi:hypothetical protein